MERERERERERRGLQATHVLTWKHRERMYACVREREKRGRERE